MARGWESKSVESQQEALDARIDSGRVRLSVEDAARARQSENLRLSLVDILRRLESGCSPRHRETLERAREEIEKKMRKLAP